jgi:hypothetical protein
MSPEVPQFVVIEDPDVVGVNLSQYSVKWFGNKIAYEMPPPQDQIPENNILEHDMPFDFIGLAQPINGIAQADGWEP